jgi:acyl dehydratase
MEIAYIIMFIAVVASFFLGMLTRNFWIAVVLPAISPATATVALYAMAPNPGFGETLLFISPFLIGGTLFYALICFAAATVGRALRARLS